MAQPCGRDDCTKCEACIYDLSLDAVFNKKNKTNMKDFGIVPMVGNPATAQIVFSGGRCLNTPKPFGTEPVQLSLPFADEDKKELYCNGCEFLSRVTRPGKTAHNCRCLYDNTVPNGKIIKLNVYPEEKLKKPFWCPLIKSKILGEKPKLVIPARKQSAMSDAQLEAWNKSREERLEREKWLAMPGITSWAEIKQGKTYHMPPMQKRGRMDITISKKYCDSIMAFKKGTSERVWLYKQDEEYKFLSLIDD